MQTKSLGIFQSDIVIRTALMAGLADLRKNQYLLDYVFASLAVDDLTANDYGTKEITEAKKWFLENNIAVRLNVLGEPPDFPAVTVALIDSTEAENTFGDVDAEVSEQSDMAWPILAGPFTPTLDPSTGTVKLPLDTDPLDVGMLLVGKDGRTYSILDVLDAQTLILAKNTVGDLGDCTLRAARPAMVTALEGVNCRETYSIGCHAHGEPKYAIYLHSIIVFTLWRYRQTLLEARGFERTQLSSSDLRRNDQVTPENVYSRYLTIQGYVRQFWPKLTTQAIAAVEVSPLVIADLPKLQGDGTGPASPSTALWVGEEDADILGGTP